MDKNFLFENIKMFCELDGVSGRENVIATEIVKQIESVATTVEIDNIGNVIAFKKGKKTPKNKVMMSCHTDEVGMIVTGISSDGTLKFSTIGGINPKVIIGRAVKVSGLIGIIGTKAIHNQTPDERKSVVEIDKLSIDIGANNKQNALQHVNLGDSVNFIGDYKEFGDGFIKAKAIDDRAGVAILIEVLKQDLEYDAYFVFCTQEEVGLRGATVAAYKVNPDIAIIVETTASGDVSGVFDEEMVSVIGEGGVISYMDCHTIYDKDLFDLAFKIAKEKNIKCQTKTKISGGNDAGAISVSRNGVRTIAVSIPSRYIHSPNSVVKKSDVVSTMEIANELLIATTNIQ